MKEFGRELIVQKINFLGCPDCSRPLMKHDEDKENFVPLEWEDVAEGFAPSLDELDEARENKMLRSNGLPGFLTYIYVMRFIKTWRVIQIAVILLH